MTAQSGQTKSLFLRASGGGFRSLPKAVSVGVESQRSIRYHRSTLGSVIEAFVVLSSRELGSLANIIEKRTNMPPVEFRKTVNVDARFWVDFPI